MIDLEFTLLRSQTRPVFQLSYGNTQCLCLLDTGAQTPIFCKGVHNFMDFANTFGSVFDEGHALLYGLGSGPLNTPVFKIADFILRDNSNNCIHYKNLKILVMNNDHYSFDMILPATMFSKMNYGIDYTIPKPVLSIRSPKSVYNTNFTKQNGPLYIFTAD